MIKILHVATMMARAGVETWLVNVLRHINRREFHLDFLVQTTRPQSYDDEIRKLGSKIIPCLGASRPWVFASNFKRILREHGPYDIVHSHIHHYSGYVLRLASRFGVPSRIAHSHMDFSPCRVKPGLYRQMYLALAKHWINEYATDGLSCSRPAAADLFGPDWCADPRWRILYYGIDFTPYQFGRTRNTVRRELNIPEDAFVVGHVGRFVEQKNHTFIVQVAAELARYEPGIRLLLVGAGPLGSQIRQQVIDNGLADRVIFTGGRPDVPRLMLNAMDVFLLPSLFEGLPLVLTEAQAAGLPCIISDIISTEADLVKPLVRRLSLRQDASVWGQEVLAARGAKDLITQSQALAILAKTPFNIQESIKHLEKIYKG
jgi:glycosyltransferase involved in cell wall biosynthesis